jgi:hypothetical protein
VRPVLIVNPRTDKEFVARVRAVVEGGCADPEALASGLRDSFPRIAVHRRDLSSETFPVWYVYRDGRWTPDVHARPARSTAPSRP